MDNLTKAQRSERMSRVKVSDTRPEMKVRRLVHGMGFRYKLHDKSLPGKPDLAFSGRRKVIFVHGCFWHRHKGCGRLPKSNLDFWIPKLETNAQRDRTTISMLHRLGWRVMIIWECEVDSSRLKRRLQRFLEDEGV
ncbi:MAG: very short patch repair endonuclease [Acidobacteriaceae bacterium]